MGLLALTVTTFIVGGWAIYSISVTGEAVFDRRIK